MIIRRFALVALLALAACAATAATALADDSYTSSTVLTVSPPSASVGQPVTFTALVTTNNGGDAPAGTVNFASGGVTFASAPLVRTSSSTATASVTSSSFPNGSYAITATYKSTDQFVYFGSTSAPVPLTIAPTPLHTTQLALSASPDHISVGQSTTFTATVTPTDGSTSIPTGDVTFTDNGVLLGTQHLDATGTATLTATGFTATTHTIAASYSGDPLNNPASSTATLVVTGAPLPLETKITVDATPRSILEGGTATLTAHVVQKGTTLSPPAGEIVTFTATDGTVFIGQAPLDASGNATFTKSGWIEGEYTITASYVGDINYLPSSDHVQLSVKKARPGPTPTLTVAAPSVSVTYGGAVPALNPTYSGFTNGDTAASLDAPATCTTSATASSPVGSYAVTCSGAADPFYSIVYTNGSVSVARAPLTVTAPTVSVAAGQPLPALTPTITGFVNGETLATSGVTGSATCTTTATASSPAGTYPITCTLGSLVAANYRFATFTAGTLTITGGACSSPWPALPTPWDLVVKKLRCERLLSSPSPSSPATLEPGQDLTIVYADETKLGGGILCPVAFLSNGKLLEVSVKSLSSSSGYRSQVTVELPSSLAPGTYDVYLAVPDGDGDVDFWTWKVTVAPPPPPLLFAPCGDDARVYAGDDLSIVYAADTKLGTATAKLSNGQSLSVTIGSAPSGGDSSWRSKRYRNVLSVKLPSSLAAGTYSVLLTVRDSAGNTDTFTWHVSVSRHR